MERALAAARHYDNSASPVASPARSIKTEAFAGPPHGFQFGQVPVFPPEPIAKVTASSGGPIIQRKLAAKTNDDVKSLAYFLQGDDFPNNFEKKPGSPIPIVFKPKAPGVSKDGDAFRFNILKTIVDEPAETALVQQIKSADPIPKHPNLTSGKEDPTPVDTSLAKLSALQSKATGSPGLVRGITIPSKSMALKGSATFSGDVTGVAGETWVLHESPAFLAHELGHTFLLFSGKPSMSGATLKTSDAVATPTGKAFVGGVEQFLDEYVNEQPGSALDLDPKGPHFSPTAVRDWNYAPPGKPPSKFRGTFLEFRAKARADGFDDPVVTSKKDPKDNKVKIAYCIPPTGGVCLP